MRSTISASNAGERIAILSPNAGRFLVALFGVPAHGRVLVPINFRLNRDEIAYIVEHSGASALLVDPEYDGLTADIPVGHRFVLGRRDRRRAVRSRQHAEVRRRRRGRDRDDQLHVRDHRAPKGVQMTHRNLWLNAVTFGWHMGVTDRDVYLHTLPTFHCNGWGLPFAVAGMGARQVVIRKIDGEDILDRVEREGDHVPRGRAGGRGRGARRGRGAHGSRRRRYPAEARCAWSSPARHRRRR